MKELLNAKLNDLAPRERILRTALILFNQNGVHRTGTDLIIEKAEVAKMTFYRLFQSKAHVIAECFRLRDADWFALLKKHIDRHKDPLARALALFDAFEEWFDQPDFRGCPFIRGLYDFNLEEDDQEIVGVIQGHFKTLQELVAGLLKAVRPRDYEKVLPQFSSLLCGAIVIAQITHSSEVAKVNKKEAKAILVSKA